MEIEEGVKIKHITIKFDRLIAVHEKSRTDKTVEYDYLEFSANGVIKDFIAPTKLADRINNSLESAQPITIHAALPKVKIYPFGSDNSPSVYAVTEAGGWTYTVDDSNAKPPSVVVYIFLYLVLFGAGWVLISVWFFVILASFMLFGLKLIAPAAEWTHMWLVSWTRFPIFVKVEIERNEKIKSLDNVRNI